MILNLGSLAFNAETQTPGGSPAWGTELGQGEGYKFVFEDMSDFFTGMVYRSVVDTENVTCPLGKGGNQRDDYDFVIASLFDKVYVNGKRVNNARFLLLVVKKLVGEHHVGRRTIKYNPRMTYRGEYVNEDCYRKMVATMGWAEDAAWFVYEIFIKNQDELHFTAFELGEEPQSYRDNDERKNAFLSRLPKDGKRTYEIKSSKPLDEPLQQIFYGAPGTGKSDEVDDMCSKYIHHRITFHPDTDYSAFVGCYKPKTHKKNLLAGNGINETQLLSSFFDSNSPKYKSKNKARYLYEALIHTKDIRDLGLDAQSVSDKLNKQGFEGCAYTTEATCMYNIYDWLKEDGYIVENKIAYEFIPQCFIKAYVDAWKNQKEGKPVFLVIEEINRGNCAQIFGDLFQLLDRDKNGLSRYEISPDTDLQEYLAEQGLNLSGITDHEGNDISAQIANGELMKLPNNLYIWATMNTSDQSLFPIDSAFKRRWDWKYIKIKKGVDKETKQPLNWKIKVGEESYDWWEFINKINDRIVAMTSTADKQLGYFFCLADNNEISADTFVNKVAFYLWNDVFKDYAEDGSPLLKYKKKEDDKEESDLTFPDFFDEQGKIDENVVKQFIDHVIKDEKTENKAE